MTRTQPAVACGRIAGATTADAQMSVTAITPKVARLPYRFRAAATRTVLAGLVVGKRADLLHAHFGYWAAHAAAVARRSRRPWIVSLHGYDLLVMHDQDPYAARIHDADLTVVPSQFLADAAIARGFPADRVRVVPSGIDVDQFTFRPRQPHPDGMVRVTFAGRFVPKKGALDAAAAMAAVAARVSIRPRFVGYGPQEAQLREHLRTLRLDAEIVDGSRPGALRSTLDDTDIVITPSKTADDGDAESLGLVNIEAQASGIPVVTTNHGGIPEAVSAAGAMLVPEGDVDALGTALADLVSAPQRWAAMGRAGSDHVRARFRLSDRAGDIEDLYAAVLERSQRRRSRP
jgi:colanic acid/amylovoran biosynthesis glycosyltransferase